MNRLAKQLALLGIAAIAAAACAVTPAAAHAAPSGEPSTNIVQVQRSVEPAAFWFLYDVYPEYGRCRAWGDVGIYEDWWYAYDCRRTNQFAYELWVLSL
jgi:hypothetical protein